MHLLVDCQQEAEKLSSRVQECTEVQSVEKILVALYSKLTTVFGLCSKLAWSVSIQASHPKSPQKSNTWQWQKHIILSRIQKEHSLAPNPEASRCLEQASERSGCSEE